MTQPIRNQSLQGSSLDHVIQNNTNDTRNMRLGLTVAVLAHVVLFVANWPSFARSAPKAPEKQLPIVVLRHFTYVIPPTPPPEVPWRRPARIVPIPDETPMDPEPVRDAAVFAPEFPAGDFVSGADLGVPEPPPDVVQPALPRVGTEITAPRRVVTVEPVYPEIARKARKGGAVILSLVINQSGTVESIEVLMGQPVGLTEAAVTAAKQWVFEPSTYNGNPTAVQYILTVRFNLS